MLNKNQTDGESIAIEFEREKRPFLEEGKPITYTKISGNVYLFPDYSGFVQINGRLKETRQAIKEGVLEGMIWGNLHSNCFIIPQFTQNGSGLEVRGLFEGTSSSLYKIINKPEEKTEVRDYSNECAKNEK
jgi:hypothetical protein